MPYEWLFVGLAIIAEIAAALGLRFSDGFTKPLPTAFALAAFGSAFYLVSLALGDFPVSTVSPVGAGGGRVVGGCAPAPVVLLEHAAFAQLFGHGAGFGAQTAEVGLGDTLRLGDDHMAGAEGTPVLAEGKVDVERQRIVGATRRVVQARGMFGRTEAGVELDRGRVRRVARPGAIMARQKFGRHLRRVDFSHRVDATDAVRAGLGSYVPRSTDQA